MELVSLVLLLLLRLLLRNTLYGRPRSRWKVNIRKNLKESGVNTRNWVDSAQDTNYWGALVKAALKLLVP